MNIARLFPLNDQTNEAGAPGAGGGGADTLAGGDQELSLHETLSAEVEIQEKGPEAKDDDLSAAARRLRQARKGGEDAGKQKAEADVKAKQEADDKAKKDAELAKLTPEERAKREAEEKAKAEAGAAAKTTEAPAHWPAADREMFAKQSPESQAWLLRRHGEMEKHFQKVTQEAARTARLGEDLDDIFRPYEEEMRHSGITRAQAIRELVGIHARMKKDPAEGLRYLASLSGIDLKQMVEGQAAADPAGESPTVVALRKEVETLTGQIKQITGQQNDQQLNAQMSQVQAFAEEKDDQGKPKRPYFDEVAKDVAVRIRIARENKESLTLQDAYDQAIYANPTVRTKVLAAQEAERKAKEDRERAEKVEAARKASAANVTGEGAASVVAAQTGSVREDLEAAMAAAGDRV